MSDMPFFSPLPGKNIRVRLKVMAGNRWTSRVFSPDIALVEYAIG
jgi:hypothetical protein